MNEETATKEFVISSEESEAFADITQDSNPIHRRFIEPGVGETKAVLYGGETISPGFFQTYAALLSIGNMLNLKDSDIGQFGFLRGCSKMHNIIVTGRSQNLRTAIRDATENSFQYEVTVANSKGRAFELNGEASREVPDGLVFPSSNCSTHRTDLVEDNEHNGLRLGEMVRKIFGYDTVNRKYCGEPTLWALASSSYVICDAIKKGVLSLPEDIVALYTNQDFLIFFRPLETKPIPIELNLFIPEVEKFGKKSLPGQTLRTVISATDSRGLVYVVSSDLIFQDKRVVPILMKRALRE